ncbi:MAG: hypothetical protein KGM42_07635 [Hyphomicrobiales bacterium]|nr:hypothetical protein [Hyphomicrobiales bacterium]
MSPVTIYLARVLGVYCLLIGAGMLACRRAVLPIVEDMLRNGALMFVVGCFTIGIGVAMVVGHNIWTSPLAVVVSLVGWLSLAKGVALAFGQGAMRRFYEGIDYRRRYPFIMLLSLALGAWLTAAGYGLI